MLQGKILQFLKMLRERGKKLFLLTNSPFTFVDGGMSFMLEVISWDDITLYICPLLFTVAMELGLK